MNLAAKDNRSSLETALKLAILEAKQKIDALRRLTRPIAPENSIGRLSRMEAIGEKSINESLLRKTGMLLQELEHALDHVHDEDFGYCDECGKAIAHERLLLLPATRFCVRCAGLLE